MEIETDIQNTKIIKKGTILLNQGDVSLFGYKVIKGCLKSYVIDKSGKEHIVQFAPEDWLISDMGSLLNNTPSTLFIDAVEDSEVDFFNIKTFDKIEDLPKEMLVTQLKKLINNNIAINKRLVMMLTATAEERYLDFIETYPSLVQRLPLKLIASYLGMTPEYLSDVRRKLAQK